MEARNSSSEEKQIGFVFSMHIHPKSPGIPPQIC
jgi:hypothetical protein